ncbi:MAG: hypothetical protein IPP16_09620 [Acidimicrobiaceae bacterium]|nr:hypothetical protein [Acidimicrobiaceae bacterium]
MNPAPTPAPLVARVVPDLTGLDKQFDYLVPASLRDRIAVGSLVRVPLHGRRIGGWVVALGPPDEAMPVERLVEIAKFSSVGPSAAMLELARWAAMRWGAHRLRPFLVAASPPAMVVAVVVGGRSAVWAPCPHLHSVVVLDEHDESLQEERTPTWHARDVAIERAARAGAACVLVSPIPTATALRWAGDRVVEPSVSDAVAGWPFIDIFDRTDEEPWKRSLVSSALIRHLRDAGQRVVCVINTAGRARLLACRSCRALQRCARCDAAVSQSDDGRLLCRRCATIRPLVCQQCGSSAMAVVKPGVTRLREELEAAAGRPVVSVTGDTAELPIGDLYVGTEAVLHRVRGVDVVAFLDFDAELFAPRYRAAEQAMALLVRAGRLVGPRRGGGRVLVQTFAPQHEVLQAALFADPRRVAISELARRRLLGLPPFRALAAVEGAAAEEFVTATGLEYATTAKGALVRADTWEALGQALADTPRPKGSRLRVEVDPPRQ